MPERDAREMPPLPAPSTPSLAPKSTKPAEDKFLCDRCGAEMFRMHAVWRCPSCGFKTDCCGW
jgi:ribosomal protein L37E